MKELYLKLCELLKGIPAIRYVDLNCGQLQEEKPPISYPAVLINIGGKGDDINSTFQQYDGDFELTIVCKMFSETNSNAPEQVVQTGLQYVDLCDDIWKKLQGYSDNNFESFTRKSFRDQNIRKGLKTSLHNYNTGWKQQL